MNVNQNWDLESMRNYKSVDHIKKRLRKGNWNYLHGHPEIRAIMRVLLSELINHEPKNVYVFASNLFSCDHSELLVEMVNYQLKNVNKHLKNCRYGDADGEQFYMRKESSHSLVSTDSVPEDIDNLLRFALVQPKP